MDDKQLLKAAKEFIKWSDKKGISEPTEIQVETWAQSKYPELTVTRDFLQMIWDEFVGVRMKKETTASFEKSGNDGYKASIISPTWEHRIKASDNQLLMLLARIAKAGGREEFTADIHKKKLSAFLDKMITKASENPEELDNLSYVMAGDNAKLAKFVEGQLVEKSIAKKVCASQIKKIDVSKIRTLGELFDFVK